MPFQKVEKTVDEVLTGTHVDYINLWASVHDEGDLYVPEEIRNAIMKKVTSLVSLKDLLDKYKLPGLSMSYDVEFDPWLSWTAAEDVDIYAYPENHHERVLRDMWQKSRKEGVVSKVEEKPSGKVITKAFHEIDEEWLKNVTSLPNGNDKIIIKVGNDDDAQFEYERLVTYPG